MDERTVGMIIQMHKEGKGAYDIGKVCNIPWQSVGKVLRAKGLKAAVVRRGGKRKGKLGHEEIIDLFHELSGTYGMPVDRVKNFLGDIKNPEKPITKILNKIM